MRTKAGKLAVSELLFNDTRLAWLWLIVRLYVGVAWIEAGWGKLNSPSWVGTDSGKALTGFIKGALAKMGGAHPDVSGWYGWFLENIILPNTGWFSYVIAGGEILVGTALILGLFTGVAAFFGGFMNMNFLLAGTVSANPPLLILQILLLMAWRVAGWYGLDRYVPKYLGKSKLADRLFIKDGR